MAAKAKIFNCSNCGAAVTVKAVGHSISVVCESCGAVIDLQDPNYRVISQVKNLQKVTPLIPLGQRGWLKGYEWEVIGFMEREDVQYNVAWYEYLLFNPRYGFRWLTEGNGHWNFVSMTKDKPVVNSRAAYLGENKYDLFNKGKAQVKFVLGEFYWRVKIGDEAEVSDYIAPPSIYMLSRERSALLSTIKDQVVPTEEVWSIAEYIEPEEIEKAFELETLLPAKFGIAPNQHSTYLQAAKDTTVFSIGFALLLFVFQVTHIITAKNQVVFQNKFPFSDLSKQSGSWGNTNNFTSTNALFEPREVVTSSFELKDGLANLEIIAGAPVDNNWFFIDGELVSETSGKTYPFEQTIEYYHGHDGTESWSEGEKVKKVVFSSIPEGKYHLVLQPYSPKVDYTNGSLISNFGIAIKRHTPIWSNFWWGLLFISIPPIFTWFRSLSFETERWANSDYSPYSSE
jgi:hypothetical protein